MDAESGLVHTVIGTAVNVNDVTQAGALLHGQETAAFRDAGYRGVDKRPDAQGPTWYVAMQPGKREVLDTVRKWARMLEKVEQLKASVRVNVEHPFRVLKQQFDHAKVRYPGLAKNTARLTMLFALSNLWVARPHLWSGGMNAPAMRRNAAGLLETVRLADQIAFIRPTDPASRKAGSTRNLPPVVAGVFADLP